MFKSYYNHLIKLFNNDKNIKNHIIEYNTKDYFYLFYNSTMIDYKYLNSFVIPSLKKCIIDKSFNLEESNISNTKLINKYSFEEIEGSIYYGNLLVYSLKNNNLYTIDISNIQSRTPNIDSQEIVYSGSKDSLIEVLDTNISLIYKRIKSTQLINEEYTIGSLTKTRVSLMYIEKEIDKEILFNIKSQIKEIKTKHLTSIGDLQTHLFNNKNIAPLATYTSKVDLIEQALLSGKAVIIIDGIPEGIIVPISLFNFGSFDDSINESVVVTFFTKSFSFLGIFISLSLLGLYASIILYEPDLIPYTILINIFNSYKGVSLSSEVELIITYLFFQIFLQAGNKSLNGLSQSILIIGSLLIGQIAVSSGFISQVTLIIVAISLFSCYIISNNIALNTSFMLLQLINFISSMIFGFIGYIVSLLMIIIYLNSLESFKVPYFYPFSHLNINKIKETIFSSTYIKKEENKKWKN